MPYHRDDAAREFAGWSRSYDRCILQRLLFTPSHDALIGRLRGGFGGRSWDLLDVGCGTGLFAARARAAFPGVRVSGVDLVASMIRMGRGRGEGYAPVQGDSERLPFADGCFDAVTCANSFHHYPHQARAVAEMRRVLKPGGRLLLLDGYRDGLWGRFIYDVCVAAVEGGVHHASSAHVRDLFRRAGFVATEQAVHKGPAPFLLTEGRAPAAGGVRTPVRGGVAIPAAPR